LVLLSRPLPIDIGFGAVILIDAILVFGSRHVLLLLASSQKHILLVGASYNRSGLLFNRLYVQLHFNQLLNTLAAHALEQFTLLNIVFRHQQLVRL